MAPPQTYKDYAVGVICALAIEKAAVEGMLDKLHPPLKTIQGDENSYTLGEIGEHNVVVACLPAGVMGNNSAATVAKDMLRSFPIKIGLMVGVGGGVWSRKVDMRLGDVVVSQPDGTHGGVVQWDLGKMEKGGVFKRTGSLNKPPRVLLNALQDIKIQHMTEGDKLAEHLLTMATNRPRMAQTFGYQGAEHDQLFEATYDHERGDTCDECDQDRVVERLPARTDSAPRIHYGNIASGNEVMKHGVTRDRIASGEGVICFEMEAAGLMDSFPCLVIRGICDYADSHKNKRWQPYAAATAAAFAKELLGVINKQEVDELGPAKSARYRTVFSLEGVPSTDKFVDRPLDMKTLECVLLPQSQNTRQKKVVLHGLGGMGKTQLAVEFARRHHRQFTSVFWLDGRSEDRLKQSIANAASRVPEGQIAEMSRLYSRNSSGNSDAVVRDMTNWLNKPDNTDWLLIFDNIDRERQQDDADPDGYNVRRYLPGADHGSILITTRLAKLGQLGIPLSLSKVNESQARAIFQEWYGTDIDPIKSAELLQLLDGLPLALAQAGTYIRETGIDFVKYVDFYKQQWRDLMELQDRRGAPLHDYGDRSIWTTWTISFKAIQKTNEAAANLLLLWAYLDNRDLWYRLLAAAGERSAVVAEHLSKWLQDIPSNELKFTDAVQLLRNYSMIEGMQGLSSYATHPVVHKWAFHVQDQEQRMVLARTAILVVGFAVPHNSTKEYWTTQRRLLPHAQSCSQWILDSEADPSAKRWGSSYRAGTDQGKLGEADKMYQRALQGKKKALGPEHTSTLTTVNNLGLLYSDQGKLGEAEKMCQRALQGYEKALGPEHTSTLATVNNLGNLTRA
ncbi:hypothetical protein DL764_009945 [Monosporascus ibericus]|uniref:Nucleoside phosphorylase domain-containing protein n=1 Tax=Monosporascus ibericus TaxID=155417 RepID=A0A4Q4STP3_9PEZI|nr:hypothetical protein DL764_009945 [Monosporascus ibericus]